jgi:eukaryotic-like serine/threonine-protein kinase
MEHLAPEDLVDDWSDLSTSSLAPGARLGRYELLLPIAYGGMARVWAARQQGQRGFTKLVAIKTILPHLAHNPEFERMFLDEAKIAAGVHHPNVTEIYELGEEGHVLYLAMEWVNGESLVHTVRGLAGKGVQALEPRLASRIVADACAGVHAAHELTDDDGRLLGVVHRDVSPHNILVSLEGTVKVTDFGVARAFGQSHQATTAGQIKGKVAYMAPEIIGGQAFDRRSDIFALGCVLYEATTGVQPFRAGSDPQVMQAVLRGVYQPPVTLVRGYPIELAQIVDRALAPDARNRYATAERMRVALEEWLAKSGQVVTPTQVGSAVRQRLGAHLDKRREHVRAAMASAQEVAQAIPAVRPAAGSAPPPAAVVPRRIDGSGSHSGVVSTSPDAPRGATPSMPGVSPMALPPPFHAQPPMPLAHPAAMAVPAPQHLTRSGRPPPSGARYAVAAVLGVGFAMLVGGIALVLWVVMRSRSLEPAARPAAMPGPTTLATAPAPRTAETAALPAPAPVPAAASAAPAPVPAAASSSPATVDINDLPTMRPAWMTTPVVPPPKPSATKSPDIPANPY